MWIIFDAVDQLGGFRSSLACCHCQILRDSHSFLGIYGQRLTYYKFDLLALSLAELIPKSLRMDLYRLPRKTLNQNYKNRRGPMRRKQLVSFKI